MEVVEDGELSALWLQPPQMAQGQPMMAPQGQPGYIPQQMQQMAQQPPQAQPLAPEPRYIVRPVASEMEAMAAPTPFDGSVLLMTDLSHGMIYAKSLNCADGTALFGRYAAQAPAPAEPVEQYAPMSAVDQLRRDLPPAGACVVRPGQPAERH
jgi:hypothetical protein